MSSQSIPLESTAILAAAPDQVSCDIGDQMAILNLKSGVYYGLDAVGGRVWELLQEPRALAEIEHVLLAEYEVTPERLGPELRELCGTLAQAGLIQIRHETRG